jgi:hypothetical protein
MPTVTLAAAPNKTILKCEKVVLCIPPRTLERLMRPIRACMLASQSGQKYEFTFGDFQVTNTQHRRRISVFDTLANKGITLSWEGALHLLQNAKRYVDLAQSLAGEEPIAKGAFN